MEEKTEFWHGERAKLEFLSALISGLSLTERNLTLSALDFQSMGLSKKHQIEEAIERAADLGEILDDLIECLRKVADDHLFACNNNDSE